MWFMALLLATVVAGCGGGSSSSTPVPSFSNSAKAITAYSLAWTAGTAPAGSATGIINETLKTIKVTVPYGTNLTAMFATFTKTGTSVTVGGVTQVSVTTQNDFTRPVLYKVTAVDGTWVTYTVLITVSANTDKTITTFTLADVSGTPVSIGTVITEDTTPKTIVVTMPYGTTGLTALVATFTTAGSSVKIGTVTQVSAPAVGATQNDFTGSDVTPLVYTVTADNGTTATYNVSVTVALNSDNTITAFTLAGVSGVPASTATVISGSASPFDILVTMPNGTTDLTALVATFTTAASSVTVDTAVQTSGTSQNDFTAASGVSAVPVVYLVTAANGLTATYNVTVDFAAAGNPGPAGASPNIGTASTYGVFAGANAAVTLVTNVAGAGSKITGDVGLMDGGGVCTACDTYSVTGAINNNDAGGLAKQAQIDIQAAYTDATIRAENTGRCTVNTTELSVGQGACTAVTPNPPGTLSTTVGGVTAPTYGPGIYWSPSTIMLGVDKTIILDAGGNADAVFIFQAGSSITMGTGSQIVLANGALAKNVWWMAGIAATIGGNTANGTTFKGTVIASTSFITVNGGTLALPTQVEGRMFAPLGPVTMGSYAKVTVPAP